MAVAASILTATYFMLRDRTDRFLGYDPRPEPAGFGGRIRAAREAEGLSEPELARRLGLDPGIVAAWEPCGDHAYPVMSCPNSRHANRFPLDLMVKASRDPARWCSAGAKAIATGPAIDLAGGAGLTRPLAGKLYGVDAGDPTTLLIIALLLAAVAATGVLAASAPRHPCRSSGDATL